MGPGCDPKNRAASVSTAGTRTEGDVGRNPKELVKGLGVVNVVKTGLGVVSRGPKSGPATAGPATAVPKLKAPLEEIRTLFSALELKEGAG